MHIRPPIVAAEADQVSKSKTSDVRKPMARSRVTNGRSILPRPADGRSYFARRLRDLIALHSSDLGGEDAMSEAEKAIVRRTAVLICALERLELKFAIDEEAQTPLCLDQYQRMSNTMRRLL